METGLASLFTKDNTTKKLQQEINGMELKKQSLIMGLQSEIQLLRQKINDTLLQIGSTVHTHHINGSDVGEELLPYYDEIAGYQTTIQETEAKIADFAKRYDEEISLLQKNVPQGNVASSSSMSSNINSAFCEKCGAPYAIGQDLFCGSCGQKLG